MTPWCLVLYSPWVVSSAVNKSKHSTARQLADTEVHPSSQLPEGKRLLGYNLSGHELLSNRSFRSRHCRPDWYVWMCCTFSYRFMWSVMKLATKFTLVVHRLRNIRVARRMWGNQKSVTRSGEELVMNSVSFNLGFFKWWGKVISVRW